MHLRIGQVYLHPETGKFVYIVDGQYESGGRVSNFWHWQDINEDGTLGEEGHGYGWMGQPIDHEVRIILKLKDATGVDVPTSVEGLKAGRRRSDATKS